MTATLDGVTRKKDKPEPTAEQEVAEELVRRAREQGLSLTGPGGLLKQLTKTVLETALNQELTEHLGHEKHGQLAEPGNIRNGTRSKTVLTEATGQVQIEVPRDRAGTFEPQIVRKRQRRLTGVDEMVLSLYAKGLTTGEISAHFAEIYGASVSKETISRITGKVIEEMTDWCNRPLDGVYAAVFIDAIMVKVRVLSLIMWRGGWVRPPALRDHAPGAVSLRSCCRICPRCVLSRCAGIRSGWCSMPGFARRRGFAGVAGRCRGGCTAAMCGSCGMLRRVACRS
jgi:Transposase, Mutator family